MTMKPIDQERIKRMNESMETLKNVGLSLGTAVRDAVKAAREFSEAMRGLGESLRQHPPPYWQTLNGRWGRRK